MASNYRTPKQERSIQKKESIKQAAIKLFSEKGYFNTSSNEIAKEAGISIGTFYAYYPDKKAVYEEITRQLYETVAQKVDNITFSKDVTPTQLVRSYIQIVIKEHEYMTDFQKQIHALSMMDDEFRVMEKENHVFIRSRIEEILHHFQDIIHVDDIHTAAFILQNTIESTVHECVFFTTSYDREKVIDELTSMICSYVHLQTDK